MNISLLDCTLRDGGYINDWNFGYDELICLYERIVSSGVDIIEVGFLDDRRTFDINRSIMPDVLIKFLRASTREMQLFWP